MRILIVNKYWYARGGAEVVAMMTRDLLEKAGHTTAVFTMQHPKNTVQSTLFPPEIDYKKDSFGKKIKNSLKMISNTEAQDLFEKMVLEFKPDVVHFHNIYHQLSFSLLEVTKKHSIPSVMTLHDYKLISPNYSLFHHGKIDVSMLGKKYYRCVLNNCMESLPQSVLATVEAYYRQAKGFHAMIDQYISPSQFVKKLFVQSGFSSQHISVVHNPVRQLDKHIPMKDEGYVAFIGRLSKEKGLFVLLESARLNPDIAYKLVGTGPEEQALKQYVEKNKMHNVIFEGWQTGTNLEQLYAGARMLVVPSIWYENAPLGILEAKAKGKIVIGSKIGGIPEMLSKEFLFSPGNAQELAEKTRHWYTIDAKSREEVGMLFQKQVKYENDPGNYVKELEKIYEDVMKAYKAH